MRRRSTEAAIPQDAAQRYLLARDVWRQDASIVLYQLIDLELRAKGHRGITEHGYYRDGYHGAYGPQPERKTVPADEYVAPSSLVETEFTSVMLQALAFDAFEHKPLLPLNWKVGRPRLNLTAHIDRNERVTLAVAPPFTRQPASTGGGFLFDDFRDFPLLGGVPGELVLELNLPALLDEEDSASERRKLLFALYEFSVRRLAQLFNCTILVGLVCFGPDNELAARNFQLVGDEVERADLLGYDPTQWHPDILKMCAKVKLTPSQAMRFYRARLKSLDVKERERVWLEFCGDADKRSWDYARSHITPPDILAILDNPEEYPPFTAQNSEAGAVVDKLLEAASPETLIAVLHNRYLVNDDYVWATLSQIRPELYTGLPRSQLQLLEHFKASIAPDSSTAFAHTALEAALFRGVKQQWVAMDSRWDKRLRDIASSMRMSLPELKAWAAVNSPTIASWLTAAQERCQSTASKTRARKKASP